MGKSEIVLYENIDQLIECEGKAAASYCFDGAFLGWLAQNDFMVDEFGKYYEVEEDDSLGAACAVTEILYRLDRRDLWRQFKEEFSSQAKDTGFGLGALQTVYYATDHGHIQKMVNGELLKRGSTPQACVGCPDNGSTCEIYSKDLMTNFGYTFRIVVKLLQELEKESSLDTQLLGLAGNTFVKPSNAVLFEEGYNKSSETSIHELITALSLEKRIEESFLKELDRFASNSSGFGNYGCIPAELRGVGLHGLNSPKGSFGSALMVYDNEGAMFRVNDQFALFLDWLNGNMRAEDREPIRDWKANMLIDCCEGYYAQAAGHYKQAFKANGKEGCLKEFAEYLKNVNRAIEIRGSEIIRTIKSSKSMTPGGSEAR